MHLLKINLLLLIALCRGDCLYAESLETQQLYTVNFQDVQADELIKYVSKIAGTNFIYNKKDHQFLVSFSTGTSVDAPHVLKALTQLLRVHGKTVVEKEGYHVIYNTSEMDSNINQPQVSVAPLISPSYALPAPVTVIESEPQFLVHKIQYHSGEEIEQAIQKISRDLQTKPHTSSKYLSALQSVQWVKSTNSLVCSGDPEVLASVKKLIESLDVALRQVFIEILVVETDIRKSTDFGIEWALGSKYKDAVGIGAGSFKPKTGKSPFAFSFQGVDAAHPPTGSNQIPIGSGFDLGVIGDLIMHKGRSYLSLGALVSALQADGESTIVLNQKIITQDNKNSTIFVGDNIPFTGSVVQTVGAAQQTTSSVEYRDVGVMLSITPKLGDGDVITIDLKEEITEALPTHPESNGSGVGGIQTTKTNMMTHVHVPDKHFLVLSGMIRNAKTHHKTGIPCLGGLPIIGAAFSQDHKREEKRNVIIFVRPRIIHSVEDYKKITANQEELYRQQSAPAQFVEVLKEEELKDPS